MASLSEQPSPDSSGYGFAAKLQSELDAAEVLLHLATTNQGVADREVLALCDDLRARVERLRADLLRHHDSAKRQ